jgi:ribosomal protein S27AE
MVSDRNIESEREKYMINRERLIEYQTNYNAENRDKILDYQKQYYMMNREKLCELAKARNKQRADCPNCGKSVLKPSLADHMTRPICMNKKLPVVKTASKRRLIIED